MSFGRRKRSEKKASGRAARDLRSPFDLTANLHAYVPREAVESCLRFTVRALRRGESRVVLSGPAGIGKTLLLHMIGDRIGDELGVVYLPYAALPPADLCTWALGRMERPHGANPVETLTEYARELGEQNKALLLLLDDANTMSLATARWLSELTTRLDGALRLVVAATDSASVDVLIEALGPDVKCCQLDQPLTLEETKTYVTTRLEFAQAPESTLVRFDDATISAIHRASDGNPRQLHQVASAVLRGIAPESLEFDTGVLKKICEPDAAPSESPAKGKKAKSRKKRSSSPRRKREESGDAVADAEMETARAANEPSEAALYGPEPEHQDSPAVGVDAPEPPPRYQPQITALAPPGALRTFRSVGIIAAALVAMVLARPVVPLSQSVPEIVRAPRVTERISTELPQLPDGILQPKPVAEPAQPETGLESGPRVGPLSVQVNATPWARIEVDGINFGATPVADIPLLPGEHTFRARMADGRTIERVVEIDESTRFVSFE